MITAKVIGVHDLEDKINGLGPKGDDGFQRGLTRATLRLARYIAKEKLSGQVLKNRTGTLRRSVLSSPQVTKDSAGWVGKVGTNVWYGEVHEFGGTVNIKAHMRTIRQAFGKAITPKKVEVRAHSATYPERSFLRTGYEECRDLILADIETELTLAMRP